MRKRYTHLLDLLVKAAADEESIRIAKKYSDKVCEAIRDYYKGYVGSCHQKIENLVKKCCDNELAISELRTSRAFPGTKGEEIQLFRARLSDDVKTFSPVEMLHQPLRLRSKSGNYRFSIPGVTSLYLANSSYGCWIEMGRPSEHDFNVSPFVLDGSQKIFNLAVFSRDDSRLNDGDEKRIHCWVKLLVLMIATSYRVAEKDRTFRSEYIVSQSIMLACKKLGYDGVAYFSKRVEDERFSLVAINLALFVNYGRNSQYGEICKHLKVDESMNYQFFRQLHSNFMDLDYSLRVQHTTYITNIGNYHRQYKYTETDFFRFDEFLFAHWKNKDNLPWGNALE